MTDINAYSRRVFIRQGALLASFAATLPHFIQQSAFGMLAPDGSMLGSRPGVPDERMGEVGKAYVVLRGGEKTTPEAVIAWCREKMANYKVPRSVEIVSELPTNATGKVQKFRLKNAQPG